MGNFHKRKKDEKPRKFKLKMHKLVKSLNALPPPNIFQLLYRSATEINEEKVHYNF